MATATEAFMAAFDRETQPHPFTSAFRIWAGRVVFEVHPLRHEIWGADVSLSFIQALEPGTGDGSRGLDWFLGIARDTGAIVTGHVQPVGKAGLTIRQLRAWYKRHGFAVARDGGLRYDPTAGRLCVACGKPGGTAIARVGYAHGGTCARVAIDRAANIAKVRG